MKKRNAVALALFLLGLCFGVLLFGGYLMHREKPPIPAEVTDADGRVLFTGRDVVAGQNYYFSRGGQHIGSIWGHGAYLAPDWSADYLHREGLFLAARLQGLEGGEADRFSQAGLDSLPAPEKARLLAMVAEEVKTNRYDPSTGRLRFTRFQAEAHSALTAYYTRLFREGNERMGLQAGIVRTDEEGRVLSAFFAWLAWAAGANRPGEECTYTSNWPFDPLVGNLPLPGTLTWSIVSVVALLLGISSAVFVYLRHVREADYVPNIPAKLEEPKPSPGQKALLAYFLTASALLVVQMLLGSATAHFTVEGTRLFGIPLGQLLPYAAARTWHLQLGVFFIATCFLAAGLFVASRVGCEPRNQSRLIWVLFAAIVAVVLGALVGTWLSTRGTMGGEGFWLGHQGYEYIELGRVWQMLLTGGMVVWLLLVVRTIAPALKREDDSVGLTHLLLYSAVSIPAFYAVGLFYGKGSHVTDAEFWRWWVVHLWVEGFFEVFATVFMAFILTRLGVLGEATARRIVYFIIFLYLGSGVVGTFHHLYWSGSPMPIYVLGAMFSAMEIVPRAAWSDRLLKASFWGLNGGLAAMAVFSLVPAGFYQFYYAVKDGLWYARSPEVTSGSVMRALAWARLLPDLVFMAGAVLLFAFVARAAWMTFHPRGTAGT